MENQAKTVYIDSNGGEHVIAEMPRIMVYNTVLKYGRQKLAELGYDLLIQRFNDMMTKIDIIAKIKEMEE